MDRDRLVVLRHAGERMFQRGIGLDAVEFVIETGEIIERAREGTPTPSRLSLAYWQGQPLHVVWSEYADRRTDEIFVITAYWPDQTLWTEDFKTRRPK